MSHIPTPRVFGILSEDDHTGLSSIRHIYGVIGVTIYLIQCNSMMDEKADGQRDTRQ